MGEFEEIFGAGADIDAIINGICPEGDDLSSSERYLTRDVDAAAQPNNSTRDMIGMAPHNEIWFPGACPWLHWFIKNQGHPVWDDQIRHEFIQVLNTVLAACLRDDEGFVVYLTTRLTQPHEFRGAPRGAPYLKNSRDKPVFGYFWLYRGENVHTKQKGMLGSEHENSGVTVEMHRRENAICSIISLLPINSILPTNRYSLHSDFDSQLIEILILARDYTSQQKIKSKFYLPEMMYSLGTTAEEFDHIEFLLY